ncbi:flagellar protein FlaG [Laribacter hongkongensis]|uniref:flagellar protein FlaG n=1 Tax=Laribacter hongkongensis TaxID=168471 RepID=UPI001EFDCA26|nr:flagellar protein FlaG [Laribacter hongkongensis]MCG9042291.1 flagellar protein FlaG [Laribacter hongkongensis]MCG9056930.1 flagellar protein FlaG [Laribacter hongkongensis]MCG9069040.1 flagellar protein FlaG [Laribacter hongkongensis]
MQVLPSQPNVTMPSQGDAARLDHLVPMAGRKLSIQPDTNKAVPVTGDAAKTALTAEYEKPANQNETKEVVDLLNHTMGLMKSDLLFTVDDDTKLKLVKIVDRETKEVIRQIPSEEIVRFVKVFDELRGVLLSEKA